MKIWKILLILVIIAALAMESGFTDDFFTDVPEKMEDRLKDEIIEEDIFMRDMRKLKEVVYYNQQFYRLLAPEVWKNQELSLGEFVGSVDQEVVIMEDLKKSKIASSFLLKGSTLYHPLWKDGDKFLVSYANEEIQLFVKVRDSMDDGVLEFEVSDTTASEREHYIIKKDKLLPKHIVLSKNGEITDDHNEEIDTQRTFYYKEFKQSSDHGMKFDNFHELDIEEGGAQYTKHYNLYNFSPTVKHEIKGDFIDGSVFFEGGFVLLSEEHSEYYLQFYNMDGFQVGNEKIVNSQVFQDAEIKVYPLNNEALMILALKSGRLSAHYYDIKNYRMPYRFWKVEEKVSLSYNKSIEFPEKIKKYSIDEGYIGVLFDGIVNENVSNLVGVYDVNFEDQCFIRIPELYEFNGIRIGHALSIKVNRDNKNFVFSVTEVASGSLRAYISNVRDTHDDGYADKEVFFDQESGLYLYNKIFNYVKKIPASPSVLKALNAVSFDDNVIIGYGRNNEIIYIKGINDEDFQSGSSIQTLVLNSFKVFNNSICFDRDRNGYFLNEDITAVMKVTKQGEVSIAYQISDTIKQYLLSKEEDSSNNYFSFGIDVHENLLLLTFNYQSVLINLASKKEILLSNEIEFDDTYNTYYDWLANDVFLNKETFEFDINYHPFYPMSKVDFYYFGEYTNSESKYETIVFDGENSLKVIDVKGGGGNHYYALEYLTQDLYEIVPGEMMRKVIEGPIRLYSPYQNGILFSKYENETGAYVYSNDNGDVTLLNDGSLVKDLNAEKEFLIVNKEKSFTYYSKESLVALGNKSYQEYFNTQESNSYTLDYSRISALGLMIVTDCSNDRIALINLDDLKIRKIIDGSSGVLLMNGMFYFTVGSLLGSYDLLNDYMDVQYAEIDYISSISNGKITGTKAEYGYATTNTTELKEGVLSEYPQADYYVVDLHQILNKGCVRVEKLYVVNRLTNVIEPLIDYHSLTAIDYKVSDKGIEYYLHEEDKWGFYSFEKGTTYEIITIK